MTDINLEISYWVWELLIKIRQFNIERETGQKSENFKKVKYDKDGPLSLYFQLFDMEKLKQLNENKQLREICKVMTTQY